VGFALVELLGPAVHLEELDVVPEHGRRGIGLRLLETVCAWAMAAGHPSVTLSTFTAVPWNAPFYQRHGFHVVKPADVSPQHVALVDAERARGLRTDLRVLMEYKTSGRRVG
jgi:GNAT superfamily N-acetyltransferase